jgi:mRNA interferase RelE/StbE
MYQVEIKPNALKELQWFPSYIQMKVIAIIESLAKNPIPSGSKKLQGSMDRWCIRVGDYRILYRIDNKMKTIIIYRVLHRKDVYR